MRVKTGILTLAVAVILSGCLYELPTTVTVQETTVYIDTYLSIPHTVAMLIENRVYGYATPALSLYSDELYYYDITRDSHNHPAYVRGDFNGNGRADYAFLFSKEEWYSGKWWLTTKLIVVTGCYNVGYNISLELVLGTVSAPHHVPVEEFWAIGLMPRGTHTISTVHRGLVYEESVDLENDAFRLMSLNPQESSLFYVVDSETFEISWDRGVRAKQKVAPDTTRSSRIIELGDFRQF